jgi:hypothetical protein
MITKCNKIKKHVLIMLSAVMLGACNGGAVQNNNAQQTANAAAPVANSVQASNEQFIKNTCLSGVFNTNGSLSVTNSCSSAQSLAQSNLKFVSQDSSGDAIALDKFYNSASGLSLEFSSAGSNQQIGSFVSVDRSLVIDAGQTLVFSGPINQVDQDSFDSIQANKTLELISLGGAINSNNLSTANLPTSQNIDTVDEQSNGKSLLAVAVVKPGALSLKINTAKAGCGTWTNCDNLTAQVNDSAGAAVGSITVPAASFGKTYSATIPNLTPGKYTVTLSNVSNTTVVSSNSAPVIKSSATTNDEVIYTTTMGSAKVKVDTSKASCGSSANCSGLAVSLVNSIDGTSVANFNVPASSVGKSYTQTLTGVPAGNYTVVGYPIENTKVTYSSKEGAINVIAQETAEQAITYSSSVTTGNSLISLATLLSAESVNLPVTIINTAASNQVVYSGLISQGSSVNVLGLEQTSKGYAYKVCVPVGYANPMQAKYFMQTSCQSLAITKLKTTNLTLSMRTNPVTLSKMNVQISGLLAGDSAVAKFSDSVNKYIYAPLSVGSNGSTVASFEKNSNLIISTAATTKTAVYNVNPVSTLLKVTGAGTIQIPFSTAIVGAQLDKATSYNYVNNTLIYVPVNQFGLISYVVTNTTDELESGMVFPAATSYPSGVTMDVTRTTCLCPTCSPIRSVSSLEPGQSCNVVFKYQPIVYGENASFNYSMTFVGETSKKLFATPLISIPFSSRSN